MQQGEQGKAKTRKGFMVYIVESPNPDEIYSKTHEGEMLSKALSLAGITSFHRLVVNKDIFITSLNVDLKECHSKTNVWIPILHISAHGNSEGIQFTDGFILKWIDLKKLLTPINIEFKGLLTICMSSCQGFNAMWMAATNDEIPFYAIIGSTGNPTWSDTAVGFMSFYHLLAKGYKIPDAVEAMKKASGFDDFHELSGREIKKAFLEELNNVLSKGQ